MLTIYLFFHNYNNILRNNSRYPDKNEIKKERGASGGTVGSLGSLELYKYYVIISGTP